MIFVFFSVDEEGVGIWSNLNFFLYIGNFEAVVDHKVVEIDYTNICSLLTILYCSKH